MSMILSLFWPRCASNNQSVRNVWPLEVSISQSTGSSKKQKELYSGFDKDTQDNYMDPMEQSNENLSDENKEIENIADTGAEE